MWEQREGEGRQAFEAFRTYRDMPPGDRSQVKVADRLGKDVSLMGRWSAQHDWVTRAIAYDRHLDDVRRAENEEEIRRMAGRHALAAQGLQRAAVTDLTKLQQVQQTLPDEKMLLAPEAILRFMDVGAKMERVARGEPETISALALGRGDALSAAIASDEGVRDAANELVERAANAREGQSGRTGPADE